MAWFAPAGGKRGHARLLHLEGRMEDEEGAGAAEKKTRMGSRGRGRAQREEEAEEEGRSKRGDGDAESGGGRSGEGADVRGAVEVSGRMRLSVRSGGTMVQIRLKHPCEIPSHT
eukprot:2805828-Rhodomonas_salina.7